MNRKAVIDITELFVLVVLLAGIAAFVVYLMGSLVRDVPQTQLLENELLISRIIYSPTGLAYFNAATSRTYPTIIDPSKLGTENFNKSMNLGRSGVELKITLYSFEGAVLLPAYYTNEANFNEIKALAWSDRYDVDERTYYVLIKEGKHLRPASLGISVAYATGE